MPFITVVPAIRTIPGVEEFDYAIDAHVDVCVGDVIQVPFRKQQLTAVVTALKEESLFAAKAIHLANIQPFLRLGRAAAELLHATAERTFTSKPTVVAAWIRTVPKRARPLPQHSPEPTQVGIPQREARYLINRWNDPAGLIPFAKSQSVRTLIITPWKHRADLLAKELGAQVLHADVADGAAWNIVHQFCTNATGTLVTTRLGAWLCCIADTVLLDEPENDDFKQDDLSPRIDARWLVETCATLRPNLSIISFAITPRLSHQEDWDKAPGISLALNVEQKQRRGSSAIQGLSARAVQEIQQALDEQKPVSILHAVAGDRARVICRDCSWTAHCVACGFPVTAVEDKGLCRSCGRKQELPHQCPACEGTDFTRSSVGRDRLTESCMSYFNNSLTESLNLLRVLSVPDIQTSALPRKGLVVITEFSLLSGAIEDTRRRERLLIAWRRLAAAFAASESTVLVQGTEEGIAQCQSWLTSEGVQHTWKLELEERALFGYPPATQLTKLLVDESETNAQAVADELTATIERISKTGLTTKEPTTKEPKAAAESVWRVQGPYPVPFRAKTRKPRWVIQLVSPLDTPLKDLSAILKPFQSRAIIDLDPIAFFA